MNKYLYYLWYIIEHKYNVGIECIKAGLYIHAITHDLSKFRLSEFIPYAKYFYGDYGVKNKCPAKWATPDDIFHTTASNFDKAWKLHYKRNKHHWDHWLCYNSFKEYGTEVEPSVYKMPEKYIKQMICDWKGMSRKFGDTAQEYYLKNKHNMILHEETIRIIELRLNIHTKTT